MKFIILTLSLIYSQAFCNNQKILIEPVSIKLHKNYLEDNRIIQGADSIISLRVLNLKDSGKKTWYEMTIPEKVPMSKGEKNFTMVDYIKSGYIDYDEVKFQNLLYKQSEKKYLSDFTRLYSQGAIDLECDEDMPKLVLGDEEVVQRIKINAKNIISSYLGIKGTATLNLLITLNPEMLIGFFNKNAISHEQITTHFIKKSQTTSKELATTIQKTSPSVIVQGDESILVTIKRDDVVSYTFKVSVM